MIINPDDRPRRAVAITEAPAAPNTARKGAGEPVRRATGRNWLFSWGVLVLGLLLTTIATRHMNASVEQSAELAFAARCNEIQREISTRLDDHARVLMSGAALFDATAVVTRETWRIFTRSQRVDQQLPGIQGIGFSLLIPRPELSRHLQDMRREGFPEYNVRPAGIRDLYSSIIYLEPFSGRNLRAFGYDMFSEPVRRAAMERARDTDAAAISGKVLLVQETDKRVQAGTLMYVPVYRHGMPTASVTQRRAAIYGWVYSPYRMNDLLKGILNPIDPDRESGLHVKVFDGASPARHSLLYENVPLENENLWPEKCFTRQMPVDFNGHYWTLHFTQTGGGVFTAAYAKVWFTTVGGTLIALLLFALSRVLLNTRTEARRLADELTANLQKSEDALRQATDRLSLAVSAGGVGIWDYDVVHNRLAWDDQMFRLYGITSDQFSGAYAAWQAGVHPEDRQRGDDAIQGALRNDKAFDIEFRVLWPDGTIRHIRGLAAVQRDAAGHPLRMIGTNWDITAQKQAEENIKQQASLINSLLDSIPDLIFFKDVTGVYLGCNPAFTEFVGRSRDAIVGKTDYELFGQEIAESFRKNDQRMLDLRETRHNEEMITYPDGQQRLVDTIKTPYWGPEGKLIGILGISRDVTERQQAEVALRESEANFRAFFETMTDMIMVGTPEGRILFTNSAVTRTLGYTAEELKGMHLLDVHPPDRRREAEDVFAAMFRGERESCPLPLTRRDGGLVPVETRVWFGQWNGANCLFGLCKNLTAEQEATQRFERLFRNNPALMALSTLPDRRFTDVNDAFLETLGYARDEVLGQTALDVGLFAQPEQQAAMTKKLLADNSFANLEMQIRRKDGTILDGLFSADVIRNQDRQYLLTVMLDITARKRAEAELARLSVIQRELMRLATEFVNVPLEQQDAAIDQSLTIMGQLIQADRAYLFAYDFDAGVMSNTHEWCGPGITPEIGNLKALPNALLPEWVTAHQRGELLYIPSVAALPADLYLRQVLEPQGIRSLITLPLMQSATCLGFVGFDAVGEERRWGEEEVALLRVLAEIYAHFQARRKTERETRELQQRLAQARDEAQAAARAKSLFLANMSHEIRTPLNAILGYAQIMEHECRVCPTKHRLGAITRSGEHLLELITDLLELVCGDSHAVTLAPTTFDLSQVLDDVRVMFVQRPEAESLTLAVSHDPDIPPFIRADKGKIRQILMNLVGNAVKFTQQGGVRLSASIVPGDGPDGITLAVTVEDTGSGIRQDELGHVFELFYLGENSRNTGKGTGLGLPLSQRYARALGGDITVTSQPGAGSCFRFTFQAQVVNAAATPPRQERASRLAPNQRVPHLLVADDDPASRDLLATMLTAAGFTVETVASAGLALDRLRQAGAIDGLLIDKQMPEMNGYEAIGHLRERPGGRDLAVLVVTASGFADEREHALAAGANGYVAKPVRREDLLEEIGRVTGVRYAEEPAPATGHATTEPAALDAAALARLPLELCRRLDHALHRGDIRQLHSLVEGIARDQAGLAAGLGRLIDSYQYDRLHRLLEAAKGAGDG